MSGILYIVATPIGNLADISQRAQQVLASVDLVLAEDTRQTQKLLQHLTISAPTSAFHNFNENAKAQQIIDRLRAGQNIALVSDAGTPLISDPGYPLVAACHQENIKVEPIPGACALIAALCASGLPTDSFRFDGFLPAKSSGRRQQLATIQEATCTTVYYESPHRLMDSLADMITELGAQRSAVAAKELTKTFERFIGPTLGDIHHFLLENPDVQRGEWVMMIGPAPVVELSDEQLPAAATELLRALVAELPLKKAAAIVATHYQLRKNQLYQWGLEHLNDA